MNPRKLLFIIICIVFFAFIVNIPDKQQISFTLGPLAINRTLETPKVDVKVRSIRIIKKPETVKGLDIAGGVLLVYEADISKLPADSIASALEATKNNIEKRVNLFGVVEPNIKTSSVGESYRVTVELPGVTEVENAKQLIGRTAQLEFREFLPQEKEATDSAYYFLPTVETTKTTGLTGKNLKKAEVSFDNNTGEAGVSLVFDAEGAKLFEEITKRNVGKNLPVFLDEYPITNPRVNEAITGGEALISGQFTADTAKELAVQLTSGALPIPIQLIQEQAIGPSIGEESVTKSVYAGFVGLLMVMIFMILYYGRLGIIADIGLIVYGLVSLAVFRLIPITMTIPGIAGFILSIGMATDANILIFERIKEEMRKGTPWIGAMELGFGKAWDSIRDANVTTLITCFILFNPLNWGFLPQFGLARGFAATLALGIIIGLFTGIVVTRTLIRVFIKGYPVKIIKA
jgi:preprotein translocase subunit SecD